MGIVQPERGDQLEHRDHVGHRGIHHQNDEDAEQELRPRHLVPGEEKRPDDRQRNREERGSHRHKSGVENRPADVVPAEGVILPVKRRGDSPRIQGELLIVLQ